MWLFTTQGFYSAVAILAAAIDYDNFKKTVAERQGPERERAYMRVWAEMLGLQEER